MSLEVPTLSLDGTPADYQLPWPDGITLEPQSEGELKTTLAGLYELAPAADTESLSWSLSWDQLTVEQRRALEDLGRLQALSFSDPLGRPAQGQISEVRTSIKQGALAVDGRLLYGGSCQLSLFEVSHLPWCPDFAKPNRTALGVSFYGRVGPRDRLAEYGFVESGCPASQNKRTLISTGGALSNWGALENPTFNWDRTARDGAGNDPIPVTKLSTHHLSPRRGSFFFAFTTTGV